MRPPPAVSHSGAMNLPLPTTVFSPAWIRRRTRRTPLTCGNLCGVQPCHRARGHPCLRPRPCTSLPCGATGRLRCGLFRARPSQRQGLSTAHMAFMQRRPLLTSGCQRCQWQYLEAQAARQHVLCAGLLIQVRAGWPFLGGWQMCAQNLTGWPHLRPCSFAGPWPPDALTPQRAARCALGLLLVLSRRSPESRRRAILHNQAIRSVNTLVAQGWHLLLVPALSDSSLPSM
ncbi:hypothetical protein BSY15_3371 [Acidovorax sp. RAC01]|nr:hypothetical protein BSY15_3371 [Acidovorax sp. RAC01]